MNRTLTHVKALLAFVALAVIAMAALPAPSHAATGALPDPTRTATLHITKESTAPTAPTAAGDGTQNDPGNTPISGVVFTAKQVNTIDLATNQGWLDANALSDSYNATAPASIADAEKTVSDGGYTLGAANVSAATSADGATSLSGLVIGLYLVEETSTPAGVTPSAPFLVTLPLSDPSAQSSWNYDVYVYPKNAITTVQKSVADAGSVTLGDPAVFTIKGDIPDSSGPASDKVSGYEISDKLAANLTYDAAKPATVALADGSATLTAGTDYTLAFDASSNQVTVQFTAAGLAILSAHRDTQVVMTVPTTVSKSGTITNVATVYPDQSAITSGNGIASNAVQSKWGSITVQKNDQNNTALPGATFQVFTSQADAADQTNPVTINGTSSWQSGSDGQLTIDGLRYSAFANGAAITDTNGDGTVGEGDTGFNQYYLVETSAPSGYSLLAQPVPFTVDDATTAAGVDLTVKDSQENAGFQLPFTGGPGGKLIYLAGALLLAGAILLSMKRRPAAQ